MVLRSYPTALSLLAVAGLAACGGAGTVERDALVSGVVTRDGEPASRVEVVVYAWPNDHFLNGLAEGEGFELQELTRVRTDRNGWFVVSLDPGDVRPEYTGDGGWVDIDLTFGDSEWPYSFTAIPTEPGEPGGVWQSPHFDGSLFQVRAADRKAPMHLFVDIGERLSVIEDGNDPADWE